MFEKIDSQCLIQEDPVIYKENPCLYSLEMCLEIGDSYIVQIMSHIFKITSIYLHIYKSAYVLHTLHVLRT